MKITSLIFFGSSFMILNNYLNSRFNLFIGKFKTSWIVSGFVLWFILFYVQTHFKNKERNRPQPVVVVNQ